MWLKLIQVYWRIALFKETPANAPYSPLILIIVTLIDYLFTCIQWELADLKNHFSLQQTLVAAVILIFSYYLYTAMLLYTFKKINRFVQTLTSLIVCHTLILILSLALVALIPILSHADLSQAPYRLLLIVYLLLMLLLAVWQFIVAAHIFKHALDLDQVGAILASFGLLAMNILSVSFWR